MINFIDRLIVGVFNLFSDDARKWTKKLSQNKLSENDFIIHDDELCPCGSMKSFIGCCKQKNDIDPVISPKPTDVIVGERIRKARKNNMICVHPDKTKCKGEIKQAHALQNNKIMNLLSENTGHVYALDKDRNPIIFAEDIENPIVIREIVKTSVNSATTEPCFCDYHDNIAFASIEKGAPDFNPSSAEMKFTYAYKAFAFDYYSSVFEMNNFQELFSQRPYVYTMEDQVVYYRMLQLKRSEFNDVKKFYDSEILKGTYNGITTCVVEIPYQIRFAVYAFIAPDFDLDGKCLENTVNGIMHRIAVTVLPETSKSYVLLSCMDDEYEIYKGFFEQIRLAHIDKVLFCFSLILPLYSENIVLSPSLWESYNGKQQFAILHMVNLFGIDMMNMSRTLSFAMQNIAKKKDYDYSKRLGADLFNV